VVRDSSINIYSLLLVRYCTQRLCHSWIHCLCFSKTIRLNVFIAVQINTRFVMLIHNLSFTNCWCLRRRRCSATDSSSSTITLHHNNGHPTFNERTTTVLPLTEFVKSFPHHTALLLIFGQQYNTYRHLNSNSLSVD